MINHIKVITFDFWNTLFRLQDTEIGGRRDTRVNHLVEFTKQIGYPRTSEQMHESYNKMTRKWENSWLKGLPASTPGERIQKILIDLDCPVTHEQLQQLVHEME